MIMKVVKSPEEFDSNRGVSVGFVPTMGALHAGHLSLVDLAKKHCDQVVVSVFVNPTQFAPGEDFDAYPRDTARDVSLLEGAGVDCVYLPAAEDIYPNEPEAHLRAADFGEACAGLESDFRPHFFDGVVSVVQRLFDIVRPDIAVFGEKDYQQLMVIRDMVAALSMDIDIIGAPIARDEHGLALSSRNAYLSDEELAIARRLNVLLKTASLRAQRSNPLPQDHGLPRRADALLAMRDALLQAGFDKVDYVEERWGRILAAAWIGQTRLIDNINS